MENLSFTVVLFTLLIWIGNHLTLSSDELALIQKRDCEVDLGKMGCTGITSSCDYVGSMVTCSCHATNCSAAAAAAAGADMDDENDLFSTDTSPNSKIGKKKKKKFSFKKKFEGFLATLRREFRLRYGIEGIGTTNGFLRLGFCKIPLPEKRRDICFFMHWFFDSGFKQLNVRFGHRVTNSSSASV